VSKADVPVALAPEHAAPAMKSSMLSLQTL